MKQYGCRAHKLMILYIYGLGQKMEYDRGRSPTNGQNNFTAVNLYLTSLKIDRVIIEIAQLGIFRYFISLLGDFRRSSVDLFGPFATLGLQD